MARATKRRAPAVNKKATVVVVIGVSAGSLAALKSLAAQLPADFPAPILVVHHMAATGSPQVVAAAMVRAGKLPCRPAIDGEPVEPGRIYLAHPDNHLMVSSGKIAITKGAHENRARPAIDPLFRSAAVNYGNGAIGVILTGYLDDGTAGMSVIHRCGGTCVVQDPADAAYPDMPQNVLNNQTVDYCVPLSEMGALLLKLAKRKRGQRKDVPADIAIEAKIAERVLSDLPSVEALGTQVPFNCPGCGGVLWEVGNESQLRFRCHTGHAYSAAALVAAQTEKMEETLWVALRMFEEHRNLLIKMKASGEASPSAGERAEQANLHIERIRAMLKSPTAQRAKR